MESQLNQLSDTTIRRIVGYGRRLDLYEGFGGFVRECAERYSGHMRLASVVLLPSLFAGVARSQSIIGRVLDGTDSLVVAGAQVRVDGGHATRTDGHGEFRFSGIAPGRHEMSLRMLGYAEYSGSVDFRRGETITRDFYLARIPRLLSQMVIRGRSMRVPAGFESIYRRGASGAGTFLTREQIDSINPTDVIGLLHWVPFVHVNANPAAPIRIETSRCRPLADGITLKGQMIATYFNGTLVSDTMALNDILSQIPPSWIQAIEVYNGSTTVPPIFQPACGAIAIWTR